MTTLRLSPAASVTRAGGTVVLRSDLGTFQLHGDDVGVFLERMLPLLDGSRDAAGVAAALPEYSASSVGSLLELLRQKGLVEAVAAAAAAGVTPGASRRAPQERFFRSVEREDAPARLAAARVVVLGHEPWGAVAAMELAVAGVGALDLLDDRPVTEEDLLAVRFWSGADVGRSRREALRDAISRAAPDCRTTVAPIGVVPGGLDVDGGPWDLLVAGLAADDLHVLEHAARWAHRRSLRSLYGHLDGVEAWIGPGVVPGETACWSCFRLRRLANATSPGPAHEIDATLRERPAASRARAFLAPMAGQVGQALAMEALKLLAGFAPPRIHGRVYVHNLLTNQAGYHGVLRLPWCDVCGGAGGRRGGNRGGAVASGSDDEGETAEPGEGSVVADPAARPLDRLRTVAELETILGDWIGDKVGVVRSLTDTSAGTPFTLPWTASAVLANYTEGAPPVGPIFQVGAGKGLTPVAAHLSAVGEAIERYSAARYRRQGLRQASFSELGGDAFDPRRLGLYSEEQYGRQGFPYGRFAPSQRMHWVRGRWFDDDAPVWLPAFAAYFDFHAPAAEYVCQVSSNGLAAGGDGEDAALRAVYELVERDNFILSWLARIPGRRLLLDGSLDPSIGEVVRQLGEAGIEVELYLLDAGVALPTVLCIGLGDGTRWPGTMASLAAHPDPRQAAAKAVLEQAHVAPYLANLMRTMPIPAGPEEVTTLEHHALYYVPVERRAAFDFLRDGAQPPVPLGELPALAEPHRESCVALLAAAGVRVAIADVTSPDVATGPFRVARALGTDMLPIHFGWGFRRLGSARLRQRLAGREPHPEPHPLA